MGAPPLKYPQEAGYPIGGKDFSPYVRIEMHYNNPKETAGRVDSSGIKFFYTRKLRRYDAGCVELGLEYTPKMAIPPRMDRFQLSGNCITSCTQAVRDVVKTPRINVDHEPLETKNLKKKQTQQHENLAIRYGNSTSTAAESKQIYRNASNESACCNGAFV